MKTIDFIEGSALLILLGLGISLSSCQTTSPVSYEDYHAQQAALEKTHETGTVEAYDAFLDAHPRSPWKSHAVYYRDEAAFSAAEQIGTEEAYKEFLRKYPWSKWRENARYGLMSATE